MTACNLRRLIKLIGLQGLRGALFASLAAFFGAINDLLGLINAISTYFSGTQSVFCLPGKNGSGAFFLDSSRFLGEVFRRTAVRYYLKLRTLDYIITSLILLIAIKSHSQVDKIDSIVSKLNSLEIVSIGSIKTNGTDELCNNYGEGKSTCTDQEDNLVYAQERIRKEYNCSVTDFYYQDNKLVYVLHSILIDKQISTTEIYLADGEIILLTGQSETVDQLLLRGEQFLKEN